MQTWSNWPSPVLYQTGNKTVHLPTRHVSAEARVSSCVAFLKVKQHFQNTNPQAVECSYRFKKLPTAVLTGIKAELFGKKIKFVLKEKERAKEEYSDAIASGYTAFMAKDKDKSGITVSIGQLPSNALVIITLKLIYPLLYIQDHWLFIVSKAFFPTERFGKSHRNRSIESISNLGILIEADSDLVYVSSSTHTIQAKVSGPRAEVALLAQKNNALDLCIEYSVSSPVNSVLFLEHDVERSEYVGMLVYKPKFSPDHQGNVTGEYIFLIDRSGSMQGEAINMVKEAMVFLLKSLPLDSKFNVISFASDSKPVFQSSQQYTDATVSKALKKIASLEGDGGTNVLSGLKIALSDVPDVRYPKNVIFLTDGCVDFRDKSLSLIRKHGKSTRFHAIGLGDNVDEDWLQTVGLETQGGFEIIQQAKDLSERLVKVLDRILTPSLTGITVDWPGKNTIQAPRQESLGSLYEDDVLYAYAHFGASKPRGKVRVSVFDTTAQTAVVTELHFSEPRDGDLICKLWAKDRISDLAADSGNKEGIKNISLKYGVPSKETAFIGVSDLQTTQSDDALVYIPPIVAGAAPLQRTRSRSRSNPGLKTKCATVTTGSSSKGSPHRGRTKKQTARMSLPCAAPCKRAKSPSQPNSVVLSKSQSSPQSMNQPSRGKGGVGSRPHPPLPRSSSDESSSESVESRSQMSDESQSSSQSMNLMQPHIGRWIPKGLGKVGAKKRHSQVASCGVMKPHRYRPCAKFVEDEDMDVSESEESQTSPEPTPGSLLWFIHQQHSDGSWSFDAVKTELMTTKMPKNKDLKVCGANEKDVWATLQVIFILETRFSAEINKTKLVIRKAENWLKTQSISYQKYLPELRKVAV